MARLGATINDTRLEKGELDTSINLEDCIGYANYVFRYIPNDPL